MAARDGNEMLVSTFFSVRSRQGGGGHEKAYVLYARVYVENYARPLKLSQFVRHNHTFSLIRFVS